MRELDAETHKGLVELIDRYHTHIEGETKEAIKERIKETLRRLKSEENYNISEYWRALSKDDHEYIMEKKNDKKI